MSVLRTRAHAQIRDVCSHAWLPTRVVAPCLRTRWCPRGAHPQPARTLRVKAVHSLRLRLRQSRNEAMALSTHKAWMLKLAHENGYLSWSRNAAICAGVGATLMLFENQFVQSGYSEDFVVGFVDLGLVFLTFGSLQHLYSAYQLRRHMKISLRGFVWICTYTCTIGLLYYVLIQSKIKIIPGDGS